MGARPHEPTERAERSRTTSNGYARRDRPDLHVVDRVAGPDGQVDEARPEAPAGVPGTTASDEQVAGATDRLGKAGKKAGKAAAKAARQAAKAAGKAAKAAKAKGGKSAKAKSGKAERKAAAKAKAANKAAAKADRKAAAKAADKAANADRTAAAKAGKAADKAAKADRRQARKARETAEAEALLAARAAAIAGAAVPLVPAGGEAGRAADVAGYPDDDLRRDLLLARVSRAIDDREIALQKQSRVFFQISGAGHEALLLGLAHELRPGYDWFFPYYRDLALMLGLGVSAEQVLLQAVGSADDPASGGRQMPAHWGDRERNVVTQSSPTGSQCIPAVGCAEAGRYIVRRPHLGLPAHGDEVTYVSLGEGATSEGEFWESLNTACTEHLPVLFVVADNGYAISVPSAEQSPAPIDELVSGFAGLQVRSIDGTDYFAVRRTAREVVTHIRAGVGPALVHAKVTRPYSHSAADTQSKYRLPKELAWEAEHDPIDRLERDLVEAGVLTADEAAEIRDEARRIVGDAAKAALAAARPDVDSVLDHVVALPDIPDPGETATGPEGDDVVALGEAIRRTLHEVMETDERVRVFGEDVADAREAILADVEGKGGVFGTTHGLQRSFGRARCYNTPLAEANIIGRAVGQAVRGLRPVPEIQFFDYIWPAMQQIRSEAATIRWRSNGAFTCPTVIRVPIGG
ncbi:MAG TPA: thiamine pyrophosphate-dependent enzyme, partial [Acidimicrobiales bacterium]